MCGVDMNDSIPWGTNHEYRTQTEIESVNEELATSYIQRPNDLNSY